MPSQRTAYLYGISSVMIWSTVATAISITLRHIDIAHMLLIAITTSVGVLGTIVVRQGHWDALIRYLIRQWHWVIVMGAINPFLYYLILFYAYGHLPAQEAQAINYTWALMLAYLSVVMLGHPLHRRDIVSGLMCYGGVLVVVTHGTRDMLSFGSIEGVVAALASTVLWAWYWIVLTRNRTDTTIVLLGNFLAGLGWLGGYLLCCGTTPAPIGWQGYVGSIYVGVFEMGITFVLWGRAMRHANRVSAISNLIFLSPPISLVWIYFVAGEAIRSATIIGLGLILLGLFVQRQKKEDNTSAPTGS